MHYVSFSAPKAPTSSRENLNELSGKLLCGYHKVVPNTNVTWYRILRVNDPGLPMQQRSLLKVDIEAYTPAGIVTFEVDITSVLGRAAYAIPIELVSTDIGIFSVGDAVLALPMASLKVPSNSNTSTLTVRMERGVVTRIDTSTGYVHYEQEIPGTDDYHACKRSLKAHYTTMCLEINALPYLM